MSVRCLLLGVDGGTFTLLEPMARAGTMPFLAELLDGGASAPLASVTPVLTPPAWTSMVTGRRPGAHGVLDFGRLEGAKGWFMRLTDSRDLACEPVWSIAGRAGLRATVLGFPATSPPPALDGYLVPGWVPWRWVRRQSRPKDLFERLGLAGEHEVKALGFQQDMETPALETCSDEEAAAWARHQQERDGHWARLCRRVVESDPTELVAVVFYGTDKLQHRCWRHLDPSFADEDHDEAFRSTREACLDYYRALDGHLRDLAALAGPEATVVVASDHGFGPCGSLFCVNAWLAGRGHLAWRRAREAPRDGGHVHRPVFRLVDEVDWDATRAVALTASANGIWIPVAGGRTPGGVAPGDYEPFRAALTRELLDLRDPATGAPLVRRVRTREEAFAGPFQDAAPDLTLDLEDDYWFSTDRAEATVCRRRHPMGHHRRQGVLLLRGPGVRRGIRLPEASLLDVAPTMLYALGLPCPEDLEGRLPVAAFEEAWLRAQPPRTHGLTVPPRGGTVPAQPASAEDEAEMARRLSALGYL